MGYVTGQNLPAGGSLKEPLLESIEGTLGHTINPGDAVFSFTQVYGRGTRIWSGIYRGFIRTVSGGGANWEHPVIERPCGKRTKLHYNGLVPAGTTLSELDDHVI